MIHFNIKQLFPAFLLADRNGFAMAKALEAAIQYFLERCQTGLDILLDTDRMPEWRLDELAWEMNVGWYDSEATLDEKRQTIRDARSIYASLGTPNAVVQAVNGVFGSGRIEEWWEYAGAPYHFRVYTNNASALDVNYRRFTGMIDVVKNVRSVLDGVYYIGQEGTSEAVAMAKAVAIETRGMQGIALGGGVEEVEIIVYEEGIGFTTATGTVAYGQIPEP